MPADDQRTRDLAQRLAAVHARIVAACGQAGRDCAGVHLVVVTKGHPADDLYRLAGLGVTHIGEARDEDARTKRSALEGMGGLGPGALCWHAIGRLQSNKARSIGTWADVVHSVDRHSLLAPLARAAADRGHLLDVFLQVSLDGDPARGGAAEADVTRLAEEVAMTTSLRLVGVMAVPPLGADPRRAFDRLAMLSARVRRDHPQASGISAGMSADLEAAVAAGATHLRVGSAILGSGAARQ